MTREKIISLAVETGIAIQCEDVAAIAASPTWDQMGAFYKAAQAEALEAAANRCNETREIEDHWGGGTTTVHKYFYRDDCIAAIREMAK